MDDPLQKSVRKFSLVCSTSSMTCLVNEMSLECRLNQLVKSVYQGGPIKTAHFLRYHTFAATTDIIMRFLLKCSEITAENNKQQFFKMSVKYSLQTIQNMVPCKCQC